jgi:dihydropteroate synthase
VHPRQHYTLTLPGGAALRLGARTLVMGIVNVTPDSFADGGVRFEPGRAVEDGLRMVEEGADILDVGGESTRPGADPLPEAEELRRVLPVVERLAQHSTAPISIDTYKATVAGQAIDAGASIVNDISALQYDTALGGVVAARAAGLVLMHNRGRSKQMYREAEYRNVPEEIVEDLRAAIERARQAGIRDEALVLDPGIGFAKRAEHSFDALAGLPRLASLGRPILVGPSRKSFLQAALGRMPPGEREWGTAAAVAASILLGAHIVRVHGVREMAQVARVADRIRESITW